MSIHRISKIWILVFFILCTSFLHAQIVVRIDKGLPDNMNLLESLKMNLCFEMEDYIVVAIYDKEPTEPDSHQRDFSPLNVLNTRNIPYTILSSDLEKEPLFIVSKGMRASLEAKSYIGEIVLSEGDFRIEKVVSMDKNFPTTDNELYYPISQDINDGHLKIIAVRANRQVFYKNTSKSQNFEQRINDDHRHLEKRNNIINSVNADSIAWFMQGLENFHSRHAFHTNREDLSQWIANQFTRMGYTDVVMDPFFASSWNGSSWQTNVVATTIGTQYPDSYVIIGAHHDSITNAQMSNPNAFAPGSNDNASGVAAVLEIARVLKQNAALSKYSIRFVTFAKEEFGLHGAYHDANKMIAEGKNIIAMINSDMISYSTLPTWQFRIIRYPGSEFLTNLAMEMGLEMGMSMSSTTQMNQQSDSWAFHSVGIPSIFFHIGDDDPYYHTVNDLFINQNMLYTQQYVKLIANLSMTMSEVIEFDNDIMAHSLSGPAIIYQNTSAIYTVTVQNIGSVPAEGYSVELMQSGNDYPLATTMGVYLETGQTHNFSFEWIPLELRMSELYGQVVWEIDENIANNQTGLHKVHVLPFGMQHFSIGNPNSTFANSDFVNYNYQKSISQTIYHDYEIKSGFIYGMRVVFTGNSPTPPSNIDIDLFMTMTDKDVYENTLDWVPFEQFTQVYTGRLPVSAVGTYAVDILLDSPYEYLGDNLVVMAIKNHTTSYSADNVFLYTPYADQIRSIHWYSDTDPITTAPFPPANGVRGGFTNAMFSILPFVYDPPINLTATIVDDVIVLSWDAPNTDVQSYEIYRDGVFLIGTTATEYSDIDVAKDNRYIYHVKAIYVNGESEVMSVSIILPIFNPPLELVARSGEKEVLLEWKTPILPTYGILERFVLYRDDEPLPHTITHDVLSFVDSDVEYSVEYTYYVTAIWGGEIDGESEPSNTQVIELELQDIPGDIFLVTELHRNFPNPFNPDTIIHYSMKDDGLVSIEIFNVRGQKVTTLVNGFIEKGHHRVVWNGTDENKKSVGSGLYFYQMRTEGFSDIKRMILLK